MLLPEYEKCGKKVYRTSQVLKVIIVIFSYRVALSPPCRLPMHKLVEQADLKNPVPCFKALIIADIADTMIIPGIDPKTRREKVSGAEGPGKIYG